jgi:hypothetical protein
MFSTAISTISKIILGFAIVIVCALALSSIGSLETFAQSFAQFEGAQEECSVKQKITFDQILNPASFFPVVPEQCSQTDDGRAVPLTLAVLPDIGVRFFGALASLIFYLFFFISVFSGIQWIYGGIDEKSALQARRNFQDSFIGLVVTLSVYLIINTIVGTVLQANLEYTDMNDFFTF